MKPVTIGILVAAAVIVAFVVGTQFVEPDGPAEEAGEAIDDVMRGGGN